MLAALAYFWLDADLIPDDTPLFGYVDDAAVVLVALALGLFLLARARRAVLHAQARRDNALPLALPMGS